jgi:uncharacterized membrane protein
VLVGLLGVAMADILARRVAGEIEAWAHEGVISSEQAGAIRARYERVLGDESRARVTNTLFLLGGSVVGLGVILFFAANWDDIPRFVRLALLVAALVAAYGAGFWLTEVQGGNERLGRTLIFIGALLFGASIFLVGQMYHVDAHDPLAFLIWSVGAAAVGVVARSAPLAGLAALTLTAWLVVETLQLEGVGADSGGFVLVVLALLGAALYTLATGARRWLDPIRFSGPLRTLGYTSCALGVFALTFPLLHEYAHPRDVVGHRFAAISLWSLAAAAVAGAVLIALLAERRARIAEASIFAAVPVFVVLLAYQGERGEQLEEPLGYPLAFNLLMIALVLGAILVGHANREGWLVNAGIFFGGLDVIGRFLDPTWDLLPRSFVFLSIGLLVLALAWLIAERRVVVLRR